MCFTVIMSTPLRRILFAPLFSALNRPMHVESRPTLHTQNVYHRLCFLLDVVLIEFTVVVFSEMRAFRCCKGLPFPRHRPQIVFTHMHLRTTQMTILSHLSFCVRFVRLVCSAIVPIKMPRRLR